MQIKKLILLLAIASSALFGAEEQINISRKTYGTISEHPKIIDGDVKTSEKVFSTSINLLSTIEVHKIVVNVVPNIGKLVVYEKVRPTKEYSIVLNSNDSEYTIPLKDVDMKNICIKWVPQNGTPIEIQEVYIYIKNQQYFGGRTAVTPADADPVSPSS